MELGRGGGVKCLDMLTIREADIFANLVICLIIMLAHLVLGLEAVIGASVASLQFGIDAVGHCLEILAIFVERIKETIALQICPSRFVGGAQL